ncbi:MBL fold metallo-hydrolase [Candidatus Bathyarchaeota archaeon]|nr:MBL fold metallo-hydrolase [Candidatus Bathyarchaeota archaeon]
MKPTAEQHKPLELHFLGTGGGRFVMTTQRRRTAGIRLIHGAANIHIDPGPGALVFSNWAGLSPQLLGGLIVTHCHPDHYSDAEVFIEAMTHGTRSKRGVLAAPRSVTAGADGVGPSVSDYHKGLVEEVIDLHPGAEFSVNGLRFTALEARHSDPSTVGIRFDAPGIGSVGYTSDTGYFPGLPEQYRDLRLLILCVMWPRDNSIKMHMCIDDALKLLTEAKPRAAVMTHFGMRMLNADPAAEAEYLQRETGIPVVPAVDGMKATLTDSINFQGPRKRDKPLIIDA